MARESEINFDAFDGAERLASALPWAVYRAVERDTGNAVRLAVLWPTERLSRERVRAALDWFAEAGYQTQRLSSSAFPAIRAYRSTGEAAYVATDLPTGRTIREILESDGAIPLEEAMRISSLAAEALAQAHASGWAHGWLNAETIRVDADGRVVLTDLGLGIAAAQAISGPPQPWPTRPGFLHPDPRRRDMQCLGLLVAQMLAGGLPDPVGVPRTEVFPQGTPPSVIQRVRGLINPESPDALTAPQWADFARVGDAPPPEPRRAGALDTAYYESAPSRSAPRSVPWTTVLGALLVIAVVAGGLALFRNASSLSAPPAPAVSESGVSNSTAPPPPAPDTLTKIQVGPINAADEEKMVARLKRMGFLPYVRPEGDKIYIQVGAFASLEGAKATEAQLSSAGLPIRVQ
ncbi:MAG TPA: hypothetical protein VGM37_13180 [Armatimonadota bacterium]